MIGPGIFTGGQGGIKDMIERDTTSLPYLVFLMMLVFEKLKMWWGKQTIVQFFKGSSVAYIVVKLQEKQNLRDINHCLCGEEFCRLNFILCVIWRGVEKLVPIGCTWLGVINLGVINVPLLPDNLSWNSWFVSCTF